MSELREADEILLEFVRLLARQQARVDHEEEIRQRCSQSAPPESRPALMDLARALGRQLAWEEHLEETLADDDTAPRDHHEAHLSPSGEKLTAPEGVRHMRFRAELLPNGGGGFIVRFPDLSEAITEGRTRDEALANAADALEVALLGRMRDGDIIPLPCPPNEELVAVSPQTAAELSAYMTSASR